MIYKVSADHVFIRNIWFNTPQLAAAESGQYFGKFGIKPDVIKNFLTERTSEQIKQRLKIPQGLPCGGSLPPVSIIISLFLYDKAAKLIAVLRSLHLSSAR